MNLKHSKENMKEAIDALIEAAQADRDQQWHDALAEPDYEAIRLEAHTRQEEKLKSKAEKPKAPQPDVVKRKPRTDKPKKKAKASSGRRGMIKKKR